MATSNRRQILTALAFEYGGSVLSIFTNLLSVPFFIHYLGEDAYGGWLGLVSTMGIATIFDLGVSSYLTHKLAAKQDDAQSAYRAFMASAFLHSFSMVSVTLVFAAMVFGPVARGENQLSHCIVLLTATLLSMSCALFRAALMARQKLVLVSVFGQLNSITTAVISALGLWLGFGVIAMPLGYLAAVLMSDLPLVFLVFYHKIFRSEARQPFGTADVREAFRYTRSSWIMRGAELIKVNGPRVLITHFLDNADLVRFTVSNKLNEMLVGYLGKFGTLIIPSMARVHGDGEKATLQRLYRIGFAYHARIAALAFVVLFALNAKFVGIWIGPTSYIGLTPMFPLIVFGGARVLMVFNNVILYASGAFKRLPYLQLGEAISTFVLARILAPSLGLLGIALALAVPCIVTLIYTEISILGTLELTPRTVVKNWGRAVLLPTTTSGAAAVLLTQFLEVNSWPRLFLAGAAIAAANFVGREVPLLLTRNRNGTLPSRIIRCIEDRF